MDASKPEPAASESGTLEATQLGNTEPKASQPNEQEPGTPVPGEAEPTETPGTGSSDSSNGSQAGYEGSPGSYTETNILYVPQLTINDGATLSWSGGSSSACAIYVNGEAAQVVDSGSSYNPGELDISPGVYNIQVCAVYSGGGQAELSEPVAYTVWNM